VFRRVANAAAPGRCFRIGQPAGDVPELTRQTTRRWNVFSGPWEIVVVILVILLLFGSKRLPDLARSIGRSLSEFHKGKAEGARMLESEKEKDKKTDSAPDKDA
jgi:TatA/E family protein of Tat protein translocase